MYFVKKNDLANPSYSAVHLCLLNLPVDFLLVDDSLQLLDVLSKSRCLPNLFNKRDDRGYTLLHTATERNQLASLKCLLIKKGKHIFA